MTAGLITLYTYEIIVIDGAKCEDQTAPSHRVDQLLDTRRETFAFVKQLSPTWKTKLVEIAIALEKKTSSLRKDDDLICRGGMEQYRVGLEKGTQHVVSNSDGHYGKTIDVRPPVDWEPKFLAPAVYKPLQDKARSGMRAALLQLIQ